MSEKKSIEKIKQKDPDPQETQEWVDSINSVIESQGLERAHFIVEKMIDHARRHGVNLPYSPNTA